MTHLYPAKLAKLIAAFLFLLFASQQSIAVTYNWVGGASSTWNTAANWSLLGVPGLGVPGVNDVAVFDGSDISSSLGAQTGSVTVALAANQSLTGITIQNFGANTVTLSGAFTVTVSGTTTIASNLTLSSTSLTMNGTVTYTAGTFLPGTGTVTYGAAGAQNMIAVAYNTLSMSGGAKTIVNPASALSVTNTFTMNASLNTANANVTLSGPVTYTSGTLSGNTTNTFIYNSASAQNVVSGAYNVLTLNAGSKTMVNTGTTTVVGGTFTMNASLATANTNITLNGAVTYTSGTLSGSTTNTFIYGSAAAQNVISGAYNALTLNAGDKTLVNTSTNLTAAGTFTLNANFNTSNTTVNLNGAVTYTAGTLSGNTSNIFTYGSAAAQNVIAGSYYTLTLNTGAKTLVNTGTTLAVSNLYTQNANVDYANTNVNLTGTVTYSAGTMSGNTSNTFTYGAAAAQNVISGTYFNLILNTGAKTLVNTGTTLTVNGGFTQNANLATANANVALNGVVTYTTGTLSSNTSNTFTYGSVAAQNVISGTYFNLTLNSGAKTLVNTGTALTINNTFVQNANLDIANANVNLNNTVTYTSGTMTGNTSNTFVYGATVGQNVLNTSYYNLTIQGNFTKTILGSGTTTVAGLLSIASGLTLDVSQATFNVTGTSSITGTLSDGNATGTNTFTGLVTINSPGSFSPTSSVTTLKGGLTNNSTVTLASGSIVLQGTQTIGGANVSTFNNLTIQTGALGNTITLGRNAIVNGVLNFTSGTITTGSNTLSIGSAGSITGAGTGWVIGNLAMYYPIGSNVTRTYPLGHQSTYYLPVTVVVPTVSTAGSLTLSTTAGDHPQLATSCLSTTKKVARYWTFSAASLFPVAYNATFTFDASEVVGGASTSALVGGLYASSVWNLPTVGTRLATTTQLTGLTTVGDVQLAEPATITPSFGNGLWNAYVYNSSTYTNLVGSFVTSAALNQNTTTYYVAAASPTTATGYVGCFANASAYSVRFLRTNFTAGTYQITINSNDDNVDVILNGTTLLSRTTNATPVLAWGGFLDPSSQLEIRYMNSTATGGLSFSVTNVVSPVATSPGVISGNQSVCAGQTPSFALSSTTAATAGTCTFTVPATPYQWQSSTDSSLWTNIGGATAATYTIPGALAQTTWYRRGVVDNCTTTYTAPVKVTVYPSAPGTPGTFGNGVWNAYVYNTTSYTSYVGYFTTTAALSQVSTDYYLAANSPATTVNYAGCLANVTPGAVRYLRTNFTDSLYTITVNRNDDNMDVILDGATLYSRGYSVTTSGVVWTGRLKHTSQLEFRYYNSGGPGEISFAVAQVPTPTAINPGVIAQNQRLCAGEVPQRSLTSTSTASSGCNLIASPYQWQISTDSIVWSDIAGATATTYTIASGINQDTWYRRRATDYCGRIAYSNTAKVTVDNTIYGDPTQYGANQWNAYTYKSNNFTTYGGYFVESALTFATTSQFTAMQSPSFASSYLGCQVPASNYSVSMKRMGVPAIPATDVYRIDVSTLDDAASLLIDNVVVFNQNTCCINSPTTVWTGPLDASSSLEWRFIGYSAPNYSGLTFTQISKPTSTLAGTISGSTTICAGDIPSGAFASVTLPSGGCSVDYYKWQKSTNGGTTWSDLGSSNAASYTPIQSIYVTTQFRRVVVDVCGNTAATTPVTVSITNTYPGNPATYGSNTWNTYAYDDPLFAQYVGYYTEDNLSFDSRNRYVSTLPPSAAGVSGSSLAYQGCQQINTNWSAVAKRQGLGGAVAGYYQIDIPYHDDDVYLYINGVNVYQLTGSCCAYRTNVWTGYLDNTSQLEFRWVNYGGPGVLQTLFTYLGATPPTALVAGSLTCNPTAFCSTDLPYVTAATAATGGCYPQYQWQQSADSSIWSDISGATSANFTSIAALSSTTYFRRKATDICGNGPQYTPGCKLTVGSTAVVPGAGNNTWNCLVYNATNFSSNYSGYYTEPLLSFNTANRFGLTASPSSASGYTGCQIGATNYSVRMLRTNFAPNTYKLDIPYHDDDVYVLINGAVVYSHIGCCDVHTGVWIGNLGASDVVELRYMNGGGNGGLQATFTTVTAIGTVTAGSIDADQTICNGAVPATLNSVVAGTSFCYVNYQWYQSPDNATWSPVVGATSATYTPSSLTATTYFRRVAVDACGRSSSPSNVVTITVNPAVTAGTIGIAQTICSGTSPATFTQLTAPTGGNNSYAYQWQSSTDNSTFNNIGGATASTYSHSPATLSANTWFRRTVTSCGTSVNSTSVAVTIAPATAINAHPINYTGCKGTFGTFSVTAVGNNLTYQWQKSINTGASFADTVGATSASLNVFIKNDASANKYQYRVKVSSTCSTTITSNAAALNFGGPTITTQPANTTICAGASNTFGVVGTGTGLTYQWYKNNVSIGGATNSTLSTTGVNGDQFRADVTSSCGTTASNNAVLTVQPAIGNNTVSSDQTRCALGAITPLTGTTPTGGNGSSYSYQWQSSTASISGPYTDISGATTSGYSPSPVAVTTYFRRNVTSGACSTASPSTTQVTITIAPTPSITSQPTNATACPGANASFTVAAANAVSYQWQQRPGAGGYVDIVGATSATLTLNAVTAGMNGYTYQCVITGAGSCTVTTTPVSLSINTLPTIVTQPAATATTCAGVTYTGISVSASGAGLTYQWQQRPNSLGTYTDIVNGGAYNNAKTATLSLTPSVVLSGYQFRVVVSGTCTPSVTSNDLTLTVQSAISANAISSGQTICEGETPAQLNGSVPSGGSGVYTYQWQTSINNITYTNITGATSINYQPDTLNKLRYYRRTVNSTGSNCYGTNSAAIYMTVDPATKITTEPTNANTCPGVSTSISVAAVGSSLSYIWQVNTGSGFVNISNAILYSGYTSASLTINSPTSGMNGYLYRSIVSGNCGAGASIDTSVAVSLLLNSAPTITVQPVATFSLCAGANATFAATATVPNGTATYQWQEKIGAGSYANISNTGVYGGATTNNLALTNVPFGMNGRYYRIAVTLGACTIYSNSTNGLLTVKPLPTVAANASPSAVCVGSSSTISATGASSYSWNSGQNTVSFSASPTGTTIYTVTGTGANGCQNTANATLTVNPIVTPSVSIVAGANPVCENVSVTFTPSSTNGGGAPSYQWKVNGNNVTTNSPSNTTYTTSSLQDQDKVTVVMTSNAACPSPAAATSNQITMTIHQAPDIVSQPVATPICIGASGSLSVGATGLGLTYQWRKGGSPIGGATLSSYTIPTASISDAGNYDVIVSGTCAPTQTSNTVAVTIGTTNTWAGTADSDWFTANNWSCGLVPNSGLDAVIPAPLVRPYPVVSSGNTAIVRNLTIATGATVSLQSATSTIQVVGNWANAGSFIANAGVTSFVGAGAQQLSNTSGGALESFGNMVVNKTTGTLSVVSNVEIQAGGTLSVIAGALDVLASKSIALRSVAPTNRVDKTARIGRVTGTVTPTSNFIVERYIPSPGTRTPYVNVTNPAPVVFLAPPVLGATLAQWTDDIQSIFSSNSSTISRYSELNGTGTTLQDRVNRGWRFLMHPTDALVNGAGYKVSVGLDNSNDLVAVKGPVRVGSVALPVTYTVGATEGWNLLGNPYPSEIDWVSVYNFGLNTQLVEPTLYIMDPLNSARANSTYYIYHATTGIEVDPRGNGERNSTNGRYIPSSQAFFVKALKNGSLVMDETVKPLAPYSDVYGNFREEAGELVRIQVSEGANASQTVVHFKEGATNGYEATMDAESMNGNKLDVYTKSGGRKLAINGLAALGSGLQLFIESSTIGTKKIVFPEVSITRNCYLYDKYLVRYTKVEEGATYSFEVTHDVESSGLARFYLVSAPPVLTSERANKSNLSEVETIIHPNPYTGGLLSVQGVGLSEGSAQIGLTDARGEEIFTADVEVVGNQMRVDLSKANLASGVYTVRCKGGQTVTVGKLVVTK